MYAFKQKKKGMKIRMIRKIKEEDLTNIMTLWVKGNFKANSFIDKDYWLEIYNQTKVDFLNKFKTYVYVEKNEILGFISIYDNEIKAIFIKENYKRTGIGTKLINYCKENLNENEELTVKIFEKNMTAIVFFSKLKFKNKQIQINQKFKEIEYIMTW